MVNEQITVKKEQAIALAHGYMRDCKMYMEKGNRIFAARARGAALVWEFFLYFEMGADDCEWKTFEYRELENYADEMGL